MAVGDRSSSGVTYASRTNTTLTAPTGIQDGDVLIIHFCIAAVSPPIPTPPTGFVAVPGPTFPVSVTGGGFFVANYTWYKIASSESGNYTITHATASSQGWIVACSGADTGAPFGQNETANPQNFAGGTVGSFSSTTAIGISTTRSGCLIIFISQDWGDGANNLTGPAGYTKRFGSNTTAGILYAADLQQAAAGATSNQTI